MARSRMRRLRLDLLVILGALSAVEGFSFSLSPVSKPKASRLKLKSATIDDLGLHGSSFCFMPLDQLDSDLSWPRMVRVAGAYPGLSANDIKSAALPPAPGTKGKWIYEFPDDFGSEYGMIAVPGSDLLDSCEEPVAVIATAESLGLQLRDPNTEILCILDRTQTEFSDRAFFAFCTSDQVKIRRFEFDDFEEQSLDILARLVIVMLPFDPQTMAKSGTWLEEGDVSI